MFIITIFYRIKLINEQKNIKIFNFITYPRRRLYLVCKSNTLRTFRISKPIECNTTCIILC